MPPLLDSYTRYPRAILWLLREGRASIGGLDEDSRPVFDAVVPAFYLSKLPVTNLQYEAFDRRFARSRLSPGDEDPATGVSWNDARRYCEWYARVSRKPMRLPSEVEWEYACRAGSSSRYFWGDTLDGSEGFVRDAANSGECVPPLKATRPNGWGLHSMLGGVWEWTGSLHRPYPVQAADGRDDPREPGPRVLRGGSFRERREELGCALRRAEPPDSGFGDAGFRIARSL